VRGRLTNSEALVDAFRCVSAPACKERAHAVRGDGAAEPSRRRNCRQSSLLSRPATTRVNTSRSRGVRVAIFALIDANSASIWRVSASCSSARAIAPNKVLSLTGLVRAAIENAQISKREVTRVFEGVGNRVSRGAATSPNPSPQDVPSIITVRASDENRAARSRRLGLLLSDILLLYANTARRSCATRRLEQRRT
jgi:hypothetical protein